MQIPPDLEVQLTLKDDGDGRERKSFVARSLTMGLRLEAHIQGTTVVVDTASVNAVLIPVREAEEVVKYILAKTA